MFNIEILLSIILFFSILYNDSMSLIIRCCWKDLCLFNVVRFNGFYSSSDMFTETTKRSHVLFKITFFPFHLFSVVERSQFVKKKTHRYLIKFYFMKKKIIERVFPLRTFPKTIHGANKTTSSTIQDISWVTKFFATVYWHSEKLTLFEFKTSKNASS